MTMKTIHIVAVLLLMAGCVSGPQRGDSMAVTARKPPSSDTSAITDPAEIIAQVDYEETATPELIQPRSIAEIPGNLGPEIGRAHV